MRIFGGMPTKKRNETQFDRVGAGVAGDQAPFTGI